LAAARAIIPLEPDALARGGDCYRAGLTIDEMAIELHDLARTSGSERAWTWIVTGYYDAKEQHLREQIERLGLWRDQLLRRECALDGIQVPSSWWLMFAVSCDLIASEHTMAWAEDARSRAARAGEGG
jgi:hypothetical protein